MRYVIGILIVMVLGFTSCDGRKTKNQALNESVDNFKKSVTIQVDEFVPEKYAEREVDTTLFNGFKIKIKHYTDMDNSVLFSKIKDTINYQTYYRNFKFDVMVEKDNKFIYKKSFNKTEANKILGYEPNLNRSSPFYNFEKLSVLQSIKVNYDITSTNEVAIDIVYAIPNTNKKALHQLIIDEHGKANFVHIKNI